MGAFSDPLGGIKDAFGVQQLIQNAQIQREALARRQWQDQRAATTDLEQRLQMADRGAEQISPDGTVQAPRSWPRK